MPEMLQRYRLVRLFLQCPFLYLLFSWVARSRNRAKQLACAWLQIWQLTLGCGVNSPDIANTLWLQLSVGWHGSSPPWEEFTVQEIPATCLPALCTVIRLPFFSIRP